MQSLSVKKGSLRSKVQIPTSKSYANRALILAAVSGRRISLHNLPEASDVKILVDCLSHVGFKIERNKNITSISRNGESQAKPELLNVGEGGTTARFLAALLLGMDGEYKLRLGKRLAERPWDEFITLAHKLGGFAELSGETLTIKGPVHFPSELYVDCTRTTQFATAFQLIAPASTNVIPVNMTSSQSYWKMTEKIIDDLKSSDSYTIPQDWSSASYPLAFAAINHEIEFEGLVFDEFQADAKFLEILKKYAKVSETHNGLKVSPGKIQGDLHFDVSDCLDLVPALSFFLAHIEGKHVLSGISNLVFKESDRLSEVINLLKTFNRSAEVLDDKLEITGSLEMIKRESDLSMPDDHRMVMTATLFLLHHSGGTVKPAEAVAKSFPEFFKLIQS